MRTSPPRVLPLFRSEGQLRMLGRILLAGDGVTASELQRAAGMSAASLHRELQRAEAAGIVLRDEARRPFVYRADASSPLFEHLYALLRMTVGVETEIGRVLGDLDGVQAATIFGSRAADDARRDSDVDLLVVGDVDERQLRSTLRRLGTDLGQQIDLTLMGTHSFSELLRDGNPFLQAILDRPRVDLTGDLDELARP